MFRSAFWKLPALEIVNIGLIFTWRLWLEGRSQVMEIEPRELSAHFGALLVQSQKYPCALERDAVLPHSLCREQKLSSTGLQWGGMTASATCTGTGFNSWRVSMHHCFGLTKSPKGVPKALQGSESHWTSSQTMVALVCFLVWRDHPDCLHQMRSSGLGEQLIHPDYYTGVWLEINNSPLKELLQGTQKVETSHPWSTSQFQTYES